MQAQRAAAESAQQKAACSMKDADAARERTEQVQDEMGQKLRMAAAEREALSQQLQALQQSVHPSAEDVSESLQCHLLAPP